jgi:transposase InsO family protein
LPFPFGDLVLVHIKGTLKGVGKVYVQVVVETFCSLAFAKCDSSKMPITACDLLYERVLPFYDVLGVPVKAVLTDNGREFCGKEDSHPYELLLSTEDIEHRNTKVRTPRTNGFVERMNRTLLDECFRVKRRQTFYLTIEEIQHDLDEFMAYYNLERTHQGYRLNGRTPAQALRETLGIDALPNLRFTSITDESSITETQVQTDIETAQTCSTPETRLSGNY